MAGRSILRPSGSLQALPSIPPRLCISPAACANGGGERRPQGRLSAWRNQNGHSVARQHPNGWALDSAAFGLASGGPLCLHGSPSPRERKSHSPALFVTTIYLSPPRQKAAAAGSRAQPRRPRAHECCSRPDGQRQALQWDDDHPQHLYAQVQLRGFPTGTAPAHGVAHHRGRPGHHAVRQALRAHPSREGLHRRAVPGSTACRSHLLGRLGRLNLGHPEACAAAVIVQLYADLGPSYCTYGPPAYQPPACCTYRLHRAACPGRHALYVRRTRTSLGQAVRTACRGTTGGNATSSPSRWRAACRRHRRRS